MYMYVCIHVYVREKHGYLGLLLEGTKQLKERVIPVNTCKKKREVCLMRVKIKGWKIIKKKQEIQGVIESERG